MKIFLIFLLTISLSLNAQDFTENAYDEYANVQEEPFDTLQPIDVPFNKTSKKKHEFNLDIPYLAIGGVIKIEYDYLIDTDVSIGIVGLLNSNLTPLRAIYKNQKPLYQAQLLGFFRGYFDYEEFVDNEYLITIGEVFVEIDMGIGSGYTDTEHKDKREYVAFDLGFATGKKWNLGRDIFLELVLGMGWQFCGVDNYPHIYPRIGFSIGKRFGSIPKTKRL